MSSNKDLTSLLSGHFDRILKNIPAEKKVSICESKRAVFSRDAPLWQNAEDTNSVDMLYGWATSDSSAKVRASATSALEAIASSKRNDLVRHLIQNNLVEPYRFTELALVLLEKLVETADESVIWEYLTPMSVMVKSRKFTQAVLRVWDKIVFRSEAVADYIVKNGLHNHFICLLESVSNEDKSVVLNILGVLAHADSTVPALLDSQILSVLREELENELSEVRKKACWVLSNIACDSSENILKMNRFFEFASVAVKKDVPIVQREALYLLSTIGRYPEHFELLTNRNQLLNMCDAVYQQVNTGQNVHKVALQAIMNFAKNDKSKTVISKFNWGSHIDNNPDVANILRGIVKRVNSEPIIVENVGGIVEKVSIVENTSTTEKVSTVEKVQLVVAEKKAPVVVERRITRSMTRK
jgi:hypothetical protein